MSTTENNSRKRDSTVLDSASTDTSDKRVRINEAVEEAIKKALEENELSDNEIEIQAFRNNLYFIYNIPLIIAKINVYSLVIPCTI